MTPEWLAIWIYWGLLLVMTVVVTIRGSGPMRRTIWTIAIVCALQFVFASYILPTDSVTHAIFMLCADALACFVITWHPAGKWQSVIGLSYILQIGAHVGRLAANNPDMSFYWWGLSLLAYVQLIFVGGWWIAEFYLPSRRRKSDLRPAEARREGVG